MNLPKKILIANRGEIAVRIIRTLKKLGIQAVTVFSDSDADSMHVRMSDESYHIGADTLSESYLNIDKIISVAKKSDRTFIHPGYGFLSENPAFVAACEKEGLIFIGPRSDVVLKMGNKINARKIALDSGVPVTKGLTGNIDELLSEAEKMELPLLIKAAAGGGGKGMRVIRSRNDLRPSLEATSRESKSYFGDGTVYIEQYIEEPRHIEVQVLGDNFGNVIHLFERECSLQRRYQKIIEESPSPTLDQKTRMKMGEAAVALCKKAGYNNAGTVEFLVDNNLNFYFLEMNTRIQVEHPVTELVTGIDIVEQQIKIAAGKQLEIKQENIKQSGHAIECRIYAEDPEENFLPSPGAITLYSEPVNEKIRIDSGIDRESVITGNFDPMIAKLISFGSSRNEAIEIMKSALRNYYIHGIKNNIPYLIGLIDSDEFRQNNIHTKLCDLITGRINSEIKSLKEKLNIIYPAGLLLLFSMFRAKDTANKNLWTKIGYWRQVMNIELSVDNQPHLFEIISKSEETLLIKYNAEMFNAVLIKLDGKTITAKINNEILSGGISVNKKGYHIITVNGFDFKIKRTDLLYEGLDFDDFEKQDELSHDKFLSPMFGKVIKINCSEGQKVKKGDLLAVIESMKMEHNIVSIGELTIDKVLIKVGQNVETGKILFTIKQEENNERKN